MNLKFGVLADYAGQGAAGKRSSWESSTLGEVQLLARRQLLDGGDAAGEISRGLLGPDAMGWYVGRTHPMLRHGNRGSV